MEGLTICIQRTTPYVEVRNLIVQELESCRVGRGRLFSLKLVVRGKTTQTRGIKFGVFVSHASYKLQISNLQLLKI